MFKNATGNRRFMKDDIDRLQKEICRKIHNRKIFVIEFAMRGVGILITFDQIFELLLMGINVLIGVHAHEAAQLKIAGIYVAEHAGISRRYALDRVMLKPLD